MSDDWKRQVLITGAHAGSTVEFLEARRVSIEDDGTVVADVFYTLDGVVMDPMRVTFPIPPEDGAR